MRERLLGVTQRALFGLVVWVASLSGCAAAGGPDEVTPTTDGIARKPRPAMGDEREGARGGGRMLIGSPARPKGEPASPPSPTASSPTKLDPAPGVSPTETFVTSLPYVVVVNGWGPAEKDRSNGEQAAGDGAAISLGGTAYARGLGVHSASVVTLRLDGDYHRFVADVGVDDEVPAGTGSVVFAVLVDGRTAFQSGVLSRGAILGVDVDVTGARELTLVVGDGGDGDGNDHGDWAGARLLK